MRSIIVTLALLAPTLALADNYNGYTQWQGDNGATYNSYLPTPDYTSPPQFPSSNLPDYQRNYGVPYGLPGNDD